MTNQPNVNVCVLNNQVHVVLRVLNHIHPLSCILTDIAIRCSIPQLCRVRNCVYFTHIPITSHWLTHTYQTQWPTKLWEAIARGNWGFIENESGTYLSISKIQFNDGNTFPYPVVTELREIILVTIIHRRFTGTVWMQNCTCKCAIDQLRNQHFGTHQIDPDAYLVDLDGRLSPSTELVLASGRVFFVNNGWSNKRTNKKPKMVGLEKEQTCVVSQKFSPATNTFVSVVKGR